MDTAHNFPASGGIRALGRDALAYVKTLRTFIGPRLAPTFGLVLAGSLFEGAGIILLLILLRILFDGDYAIELFGAQLGGDSYDPVLLAAALGFFVLVASVRAIVLARRDNALMALSLGFVDHWRQRLATAVASSSWNRIIALKRERIEHALINDVQRVGQGTRLTLTAGAALVMLVVQLGIAVTLAPLLALAGIVGLVILIAASGGSLRRARTSGHEQASAGERMVGILGRFMSGIKSAKIYRQERQFLHDYSEAVSRQRARQMEFSQQQNKTAQGIQWVAAFVAAVLVWVGLVWMKLDPAVLLVLILVLSRAANQVAALARAGQSFANMIPAIERIEALISEAQPDPADTGASPVSAPLPTTAARLELRQVTYTYPGKDTRVLDGVDMDCEAGSLTVISGPSGAGKTTLLDIMGGLLDPDSGKLVTDGQTLESYGRDRWATGIAYMAQDALMFDRSIRENLHSASGMDISDAEIERALDIAQARELVSRLPGGLDTRMGGAGLQFSGGEKQRLALARALLRRPRLLLLDEATNALDNDTEAQVIANLCSMAERPTMIALTHRPEAFGQCDQRLVLDAGTLRPA